LDHLNESKKYLNAMSKDTSKSVGSNNNDSSIVFKLFRDLESEELERASRVNLLFMIVLVFQNKQFYYFN
jgi:hypothetical protein